MKTILVIFATSFHESSVGTAFERPHSIRAPAQHSSACHKHIDGD
ncbi:hypothetical protein [Microcoleus vaginatus]